MKKEAFNFLLLLGMLFISGGHVYSTNYFVKEGSSGLGTGFSDAFGELTEALQLAVDGDTIFVAAGTYMPHISDRSVSFEIPSGVKLFGGFTGSEMAINTAVIDARDIKNNPTILSGEIQQDADSFNNSFHVVYFDGTNKNINSETEINGFIIEKGHANGTSAPDGYGGGMLMYIQNGHYCHPKVRNVILRDNDGNYGGGLAIRTMGASSTANPEFYNIEFIGNTCFNSGGGMYIFNGSSKTHPTFNEIIFTGNIADPTGSHVKGAAASFYCYSFQDHDTLMVDIQHMLAYDNTGDENGGVFYSKSHDNNLTYGTVRVNISNATIANNNSNRIFYNYQFYGSSRFILTNVINYNPGKDEFYNYVLYTTEIGNSYVRGCNASPDFCAALTDKGNNVDGTLDIAFYDLANNDFTLYTHSPAFGAGKGGVGDNIGYYQGPGVERQFRRYVKENATGNNDGTGWEDAFNDLQDALAAAVDGDTVLVANGTYRPHVSDRNVSFDIPDGVRVFGGFAGNEVDINQSVINARDFISNRTILTAEIQEDGDSSNNAYHVVKLMNKPETTELNGFTIREGHADGLPGLAQDVGGGIIITKGSPVLANLIIEDNKAGYGGGIYIDTLAYPIIKNIQVTGNYAYGGGAIWIYNSSAFIDSALIADNQGNGQSAGIQFYLDYDYKNHDGLTLKNATIYGNHSEAEVYGGAGLYVWCYERNCTISNSIIWGNTTKYWYQDHQDLDVFDPEPDSKPYIDYSIIGETNRSGPEWNTVIGFDNGNNYDEDPLLVDPENGDYGLFEGSVAIGNGPGGVNIGYYQGDAVARPSIISNGLLTDFGDIDKYDYSTEQSFSVEGVNLIDDVWIIAPQGFQLSSAPNDYSGHTDTIILTPSAGTLEATTVYIRFAPSLVSEFNDSIKIQSKKAEDIYVTCQGTGLPVPEVATSAKVLNFEDVNLNKQSNQLNFTVSGTELTGDMLVIAPGDFKLSLTSMDFTGNTDTIKLSPVAGSVEETTIYAVFNPTVEKSYQDSIIVKSAGARPQNIDVAGDVMPYTEWFVTTFPGGLQDGSDWDNSMSLYAAIDSASPGDRIYAASGVYKAVNGGFFMNDHEGIEIYGGFEGNETSITSQVIEDRDLINNASILDADIIGDDLDWQNRDDNRTNLLYIYFTDNIVVDGFILRGNHDITWNPSGSAAFIREADNIVLRNLIFYNNYSAYSAGAFTLMFSKNVTIENCLVHNNMSAWGSGSYYSYYSSAKIVNSTFMENVYDELTGTHTELVHGTNNDTLELVNTLIWTSKADNDNYNMFDSTKVKFKNSLVMFSGGSSNWNGRYGIDLGGNLDEDPLLVYAANGDAGLFEGSPALGSGDPMYGTNIGYYQGTGIPKPVFTASPGMLAFGDIAAGAHSPELSFVMQGHNIPNEVTVIAPEGYEISTLSGDYTSRNDTIILYPGGGMMNPFTIYVKFVPNNVKNFDDDIYIFSVGMPLDSVHVTGTGITGPYTLDVSETSIDFGNVLVGTSAIQQFTITGNDLTGDVHIQAASGFLVSESLNEFSFGMDLFLTPDNGALDKTIYVKFIPDRENTYNIPMNINVESNTVRTVGLYGYGTISNAIVSIDREAIDFGEFTVGTTSHFETYPVMISNVQAGDSLVVVCPEYFQVSDTNDGFSDTDDTLVFYPNGDIIERMMFVRFNPGNNGLNEGNLLHYFNGTLVKSIYLSGQGFGGVDVQEKAFAAIRLYPNPARNIIKIAGLPGNPVDYAIVNMQGKKVQSGVVNRGAIDISGLDQGYYMLKVIEGGRSRALVFAIDR